MSSEAVEGSLARGVVALGSGQLLVLFCLGVDQASLIFSGQPSCSYHKEVTTRSKLLVVSHLLTQQTLTKPLFRPRVCWRQREELEVPLCGPCHHPLLPPEWVVCLSFVPYCLFSVQQPGSLSTFLPCLTQSSGSPVLLNRIPPPYHASGALWGQLPSDIIQCFPFLTSLGPHEAYSSLNTTSLFLS